jgi:hypothetical protein
MNSFFFRKRLHSSLPYAHQQKIAISHTEYFLGLSKKRFCLMCTKLGYLELAKWGYYQNCLLMGAIPGAASFLLSPTSDEARVLSFMEWVRSEGARITKEDIFVAAESG